MIRIPGNSKIFFAATIGLISYMLTPYAQPVSMANAASVQAQLPYDDVRDNYATESIMNMTKRNVITGTGMRKFEPDKAIARAEFAVMLDRLLGMQPVASAIPAFADVSASAWYYGWIQTSMQLGLTQGTSANAYEPARAVTREEAAVILARALKLPAGAANGNGNADGNANSNYADRASIAAWATPAVDQLTRMSLLAGDDGRFRPRDKITRQEAAVMLNRIATRSAWSAQLLTAAPDSIQLGWQYGQTTRQFENTVARSVVNTLSPRWFFLGPAGKLEDYTDVSLITWSHARGKRVWAMVGNHADQVATHVMLADSHARQAFVQQLTERIKQTGIDGLNVDFENMMPEDRQYFTALITALHQSLAALPATLSVNVSPDFGTDWTDAFDYAALGRQADYVVLMGYDEHWAGDPVPGSVASLPWLKSGLDRLSKQVTADRILLAMPLYNRDWTTVSGGTGSEGIDLVQQNEIISERKLAPHWNERLGQYYASYKMGTAKHEIWLEEGRSLARKIMLGASYAHAGNAYWYMGGESAEVWTSAANAIRFGGLAFN